MPIKKGRLILAALGVGAVLAGLWYAVLSLAGVALQLPEPLGWLVSGI